MTCFVFCMNIGENVQDVPLPKDRRITDFMKKVFCEYEKIRGTLYLNYLFFYRFNSDKATLNRFTISIYCIDTEH